MLKIEIVHLFETGRCEMWPSVFTLRWWCRCGLVSDMVFVSQHSMSLKLWLMNDGVALAVSNVLEVSKYGRRPECEVSAA